VKTIDDILIGLSPLIGEELVSDSNRACLLVFNDRIKIQLELDITGEFLILGSILIELPPGKFRENILKSGLKANNLIHESPGILAFIVRANSLVLFEKIHISRTAPDPLYKKIIQFFNKAENWKRAIEKGEVAPRGAFPEKNPFQEPKLFGMK
jgi:hypothetical protein